MMVQILMQFCFPWTVISDFDKKDQENALRKASGLLKENGIVILDNPAKGTPYNIAEKYSPAKFYYDDWEDGFTEIGFTKSERLEYTTATGRRREIVVLAK